jgi:hypothetical protein
VSCLAQRIQNSGVPSEPNVGLRVEYSTEVKPGHPNWKIVEGSVACSESVLGPVAVPYVRPKGTRGVARIASSAINIEIAGSGC